MVFDSSLHSQSTSLAWVASLPGLAMHSQSTSLAWVTIVSRCRYALFATKRRQPYQPGISSYGLFRHALIQSDVSDNFRHSQSRTEDG
ncbi:hypothetical protein JOE21_001525 [Desmospora profundinema]|uniref:Secreted protein n=1 Tax=Desmospora profundinema TaxID=1571184 RepID=A0ABU1IL65_9BACL|nr:hypothetical protein [Desmospora profundinema]